MQGIQSKIRTSSLTLEEIPVTIEVQRKRIRNINLYVKPGACVVISAPLTCTDEEIRKFALSKHRWLTKQLREMQNKPVIRPLQYADGEVIRIWGVPHTVRFRPDKSRDLTIRDECFVLTMPAKSSRVVRERFVKEKLRERLERKIKERLPLWEEAMGLYAKDIAVRDMKSRWGVCNIGTGKLTFALELIRFDPVCLDYIIVHELAHLRHRNHSKAFWNLVGKYLPDWKRIRNTLERPVYERAPEETDAGN